MAEAIPLRGVKVHNLQGIDVDVPLRKMTVVTGVSGAGKSSLVFDTLFAEAQRRYLQGFSPYVRQFLERFDKPAAEFIGELPPAIALGRRALPRNSKATVGSLTEISEYLESLSARRGIATCAACGRVVRAYGTADVVAEVASMSPGRQVSVGFPAPIEKKFDAKAWAAGLREEGFVRVRFGGKIYRFEDEELLNRLSAQNGDRSLAWILLDRLETGKTSSQRWYESIETAFTRGRGRAALFTDTEEKLYDRILVCPYCEGNPGLTVRYEGATIAELSGLALEELAWKFAQERNDDESLLRGQIQNRLGYLNALELGYLTLDRAAATLSMGELRRVRLTTALGATLAQAMYLFEEPTAGLHPRDVGKVIFHLRNLRDAGNTVVLVDHDLDVIRAADWVIDLGPGAGEEGGRLLYQGPPDGLAGYAESVTGEFLQDDHLIPVPTQRRPLAHGSLRLKGARLHNLQNLTVDFPLGVLCVVTGVSGSGKSTLVEQTLYPALCACKHKKNVAEQAPTVEVEGASQIADVLLMDQEPLGRTARSNPATYLKIFDDIRTVFADTGEARIHNFGPGTFSFNQPGGRCEACEGQGTLIVDMQFLADVTMTCPECQGARFKKEVLNVQVRGLSIAEVLNLTVREAFRFFRAQRNIEKRLKYLLDVGLDYLRLGQPIDTLSGGECQRLKLAGHLATSRKARCLFILLEPSTGLHRADVEHLLACLQRLLETGHSLLVVEHHPDIIKYADHVIDLGPGAGAAGGRVVAIGTPEEVAQVPESYTGQWLRKLGI
jgi:excinuclease ABC subunit A